jgi:hypothetical protein
MQRCPRMMKGSRLKKIDVYLLAVYSGVLPVPNGKVQINGLSATDVAENTIASMTTINRIG